MQNAAKRIILRHSNVNLNRIHHIDDASDFSLIFCIFVRLRTCFDRYSIKARMIYDAPCIMKVVLMFSNIVPRMPPINEPIAAMMP